MREHMEANHTEPDVQMFINIYLDLQEGAAIGHSKEGKFTG